MPSTDNQGRRALMGTAAVLPILGVWQAGHAGAPNPDAMLIALCDEMLAGDAEADRLQQPYYEVPGGCQNTKIIVRLEAISARYHELVAAIAETPATTLAGCRAKAMACRAQLALDAAGEVLNPDDFMAASLFDDLLRGA